LSVQRSPGSVTRLARISFHSIRATDRRRAWWRGGAANRARPAQRHARIDYCETTTDYACDLRYYCSAASRFSHCTMTSQATYRRVPTTKKHANERLDNMKKFVPLVLVLGVLTAGAAIALARTIHIGATQARFDAGLGRPAAAAPVRGSYLIPNCQQHKPLCDLQTY